MPCSASMVAIGQKLALRLSRVWIKSTRVMMNLASFLPVSSEASRVLEETFADFELADYVKLLKHTNGLGELADVGGKHFVHNMLVLPVEEAMQESKQQFDGEAFVFGRPGVDGILFTFKPHDPAVLAYYPIDREFVQIAASLNEFLQAWESKTIRL